MCAMVRYYKQLVPLPFRRRIWDESVVMLGESVTFDGVAGMACFVLESYLYELPVFHKQLSDEDWRARLDGLKHQMLLHVVICLQLAAKMISSTCPDMKKVQEHLQDRGYVYSIKKIVETERAIFKIIGFKVPMRSNVNEATNLAHDVGLSPAAIETAGLLTYLAELNLPVLLTQVQNTWATSSEAPEVHCIEPRELSAGAVIAARQYLPGEYDKPGTQALAEAARWADVDPAFIECISDCILMNAVAWKRKHQKRGRAHFSKILAKIRKLEPKIERESPEGKE